MMVLRSASLSVCIYYLFLGKYMEFKTQVSTGMMAQPVCTRLVDQLQIKYGKIRSDISGELRLENNYHNKFKNQFNFWDVTFYLCTGEYQLYKKPNNTPTYINVNSNHRPNIIKALPDNISKRINNISSDKGTFNNAAPSSNDVLSSNGYKDNLTYQ